MEEKNESGKLSENVEIEIQSPSPELPVNEGQVDEDFSSWSKVDLYERLKKIIEGDSMRGSKTIVSTIKDIYRGIIKKENEQKLNEHISTGGTAEDFYEVPAEQDVDFEALIKKYYQRRKEIKVQKEKKLFNNLSIKKQIIEDLRELAKTSENLSKAFGKFHDYQAKWRETGPVPSSDEEDLWQNYRFQVDLFFNMVKLNKEFRELDRLKNIELKTTLCEKAEKLAEERVVLRAVKMLKKLQDDWKDIGYISKDEGDFLWDRFKTAANAVYLRQKEENEKVKLQQDENLKAKKLLCEQMEKMLENVPVSHKALRLQGEQVEELMQQWKKISYVPKSDNGQTWERFKTLRKQFFKQKDVFYNQLKSEQDENLKIKIAFCEKAEALKDSTEWEKTANDLKRLQQDWKNSGPVSPKFSDKVWKRFRTACDTFFENKNKVNAEQNALLNGNLEKRRSIIKQLADLPVAEDNQDNIDKIKNLQEEFEQAGEISVRDSEMLTKDFHRALDRTVNKIKEKTDGNVSEFLNLRYENLLKTEEGKNTIRKERRNNEDKIKHLQAEVLQLENNLGFFGKSKNAAAMLVDFQTKIDAGKSEIKTLKDDLNRIPRV